MNTETHYLGKPCKRGHVNAEGFTERRKDNGSCASCVAIMREKKFSALKELGSKYWGTPCLRNHVNAEGKTERWAGGGMCIECSKIFKRVWNQSDRGQELQRISWWKCAGMPTPTRPEPRACEICDKPNMLGKSLANDHCYVTGKFRGWLCTSCNSAIGHLGDSLEGVLRAAEYLRKNTPAV